MTGAIHSYRVDFLAAEEAKGTRIPCRKSRRPESRAIAKSIRPATVAYQGRIGRIGLDLGITAGGKMIWGVHASTTSIAPRALVGDYVGASGDISPGAGVGANALVGGSHHTIALQPLSLSKHRSASILRSAFQG